jgi:hypothetical protein
VRITYKYGGDCEELIIASSYLPQDSDEPQQTKELRGIIDRCQSRENQLIVELDANAHDKLFGSTVTNPKGESLMEFLVRSNLNILNHRKEPTFVVCNKKVIDLTLVSNNIGNPIIGTYPMSRLFQTTDTYTLK